MNKPTISLCMIVRDEAETLRSAIECVKPLCDEIVIGIDSRSSDESESIASEYADILYKFSWNGSFSEARNESISKCTKEWLLIWDAHEIMSGEHVEKIRDKMWSVVEDSCPAIGLKLIMEDGAVGGVSIGVRREIIDSMAGSQVVITTALSSLTVGDYFKIVADASGTDFNYIRDAGSIASHGTVEAAHFNRSIVEARNLLFNPDFSRVFVSGLAENWSVVTIGGSFPVSEVTDTNFVRFGSKSQKIEEADVGEGITQSVILKTNSIYSLYVWVYVVSGKVKLEFNDGADDQPSASGETAETSINGVWSQLIVEGIIAKSTAGTVKILSNEAQSEFYVDSVMVEKAARLSVPNEFYAISGARLLWDEGFDALQENKTPKTKYVINALDLYEMDPDAFQYDKIEVGDTILVQDDELGIDISARVKSKKVDLLEPWKTEYEIDNFTDRLPKTLRNEARRNNRLTRNIGNLMGRRVDDRKLSDSGLAVNKRELRILG